MKNIFLILILFFAIATKANAQTDEHNTSFNVEGQIIASANSSAFLISMGGAALKFNFSKFTVALCTGPNLKYEKQPGRVLIMPILTAGPQIYFLKNKRFIVSMPMYYNSILNEWIFTGGIGYVFTKPKPAK